MNKFFSMFVIAIVAMVTLSTLGGCSQTMTQGVQEGQAMKTAKYQETALNQADAANLLLEQANAAYAAGDYQAYAELKSKHNELVTKAGAASLMARQSRRGF